MVAPKAKSASEVKTMKNVCANNQFLRFNGLIKPTRPIKNETTIEPPTPNPPKNEKI
jgi:hypothetical protein